MNTIHWAFIARHAVWILGLAIVLAVWSYADWQAHSRQIRRRVLLVTPLVLSPLCAGWALFCIGMALVSGSTWQSVAWSVVGLLLAGQAVWYWRARHETQP